ncbi:DUF58 domain-containing protein [Paenibacillus sp. PR3]|uniref:DUF58 domain-containing protein n=1 Tax=Paenibacillus terricola TaxID=2763503 RepID=A0ABR8MZN5_9BACL|nr:DUF58 domain-containing protein [Paenibacillus terricola]MBD3921055.1 DUF58 domain-containing protein [Paenibacillus terricola]
MNSGSIPRAASTTKVKGALNGTANKPKQGRLQQQPIYRTRRWMWTVLTAGWMFAVSAAAWRGQMPELFAAVLLSGIVVVGMLPVFVARVIGIEAFRMLSAPEAAAGGELQVTLTLRMRMPLPLLWVYVREECRNESGGQQRTVHYGHVGLPWQAREWKITYAIRELARGAYRYRPIEITIGDAFGLTAIKRVVPVRMANQDDKGKHENQEKQEGKDRMERASFLVLPDWSGHLEYPTGGSKSKTSAESRILETSAGGYVHGTERARPRQRTTVADRSGMQRQPYRPGDDARHIDWRAASRGGSWVTKRESASQPPALLLLLDTAAEAYDSNDYWFDAAAGYAAAQVRYAVSSGLSFRLLDSSEQTVSNGSGQQSSRLSAQREALERLARMKPTSTAASVAGKKGITSVESVLKREGISSGATFMLITAEWRSGEIGEQLAAYAASNGCRIEVHVLTANRLPSAAMRARQRDWESAGIRVVWVLMPDSSDIGQQTAIAEGGEGHERASQ